MGGKEDRRAEEVEFTEFVRDSQLRLCRVAFWVCGDWHRAEDIVQIALTRLYSRWSTIRREDGPDRYAHRVVVNAAIDDRRRPSRWREHATDELPEVVTGAPVPDGIAATLAEALATLPARQRAVVVLRLHRRPRRRHHRRTARHHRRHREEPGREGAGRDAVRARLRRRRREKGPDAMTDHPMLAGSIPGADGRIRREANGMFKLMIIVALAVTVGGVMHL